MHLRLPKSKFLFYFRSMTSPYLITLLYLWINMPRLCLTLLVVIQPSVFERHNALLLRGIFYILTSWKWALLFLYFWYERVSYRLTNSLMMHGRNNGKKLMAVRIIKHAMEIIHLLSDQNPIQVIVDAIINRLVSCCSGCRDGMPPDLRYHIILNEGLCQTFAWYSISLWSLWGCFLKC